MANTTRMAWHTDGSIKKFPSGDILAFKHGLIVRKEIYEKQRK